MESVHDDIVRLGRDVKREQPVGSKCIADDDSGHLSKYKEAHAMLVSRVLAMFQSLSRQLMSS